MNAKEVYRKMYSLAREIDAREFGLHPDLLEKIAPLEYANPHATMMARISMIMARHPGAIRKGTNIRKLFEIEKQIEDESIIKW